MAILMLGLWGWQVKTRNAGAVDVAWAFGTGLVGVWFVLGHAEGEAQRHWLLAALIGLWGLRLGWHLALRVVSESEDGRYRHLRQSLGGRIQPVMFVFFQIQALWALLFALPVWAAAASPDELGWVDAAGVTVWMVALAGESASDRQLSRFRASPGNTGAVCTSGLWGWSRHPNYFFEWLHWFAYLLIGWGSPHWWVCLAGIPLMYFFLTRLTGVPWTEQQALRSRGDAYREYQRTTSLFFPRPPRPSTGNLAKGSSLS